MKNIYHIVSDFKYGGVEIAARSSIIELNKNYNFYIVCVGKVHNYFVESLSNDEKKMIIELNYKSFNFFKQLSNFVKIVRNNEPDIFILSLWKGSLFGLILKLFYKRIKYISFIHSTKFFHFLDSYVSKKAIKKFDVVFVDSNSTKEFVYNQNKDARIKIISFLTNKFKSDIKKLNINKINFLFLGRLSKEKRLDKSLNIIYELVQKNLNIQYNIYGKDDGEEMNIRKQIKDMNLENHVYIHNPVDPIQLNKIFDSHQFYLQLSDNEGMAMSVCEAMQNGLVCCVTPVGEIKNYSKNMFSAVHLLNNNIQKFISDITLVIENEDKFKNISRNSIEQWKNQILYKEDMSKNLSEILGNK